MQVSLVERAIASDPYSTPPDRPISCFSPEELEQWAMRRLSLKKGWLLDHTEGQTRDRTVRFSPSAEVTCLIPGGRWLVSALEGGKVVATDLDRPEAPHQVLLEPHDKFDTWPATDLLFDIDRQESTLTFNLALCRNRPSVYLLRHGTVSSYLMRILAHSSLKC